MRHIPGTQGAVVVNNDMNGPVIILQNGTQALCSQADLTTPRQRAQGKDAIVVLPPNHFLGRRRNFRSQRPTPSRSASKLLRSPPTAYRETGKREPTVRGRCALRLTGSPTEVSLNAAREKARDMTMKPCPVGCSRMVKNTVVNIRGTRS